MVFSALTLPPGDDLRLWKDQGQLIRTPTPQNIPTSLPTPSPHISLSNNNFPWLILNPLPGPLAQLFSLISARFIFSLLVLHHSLLFHRIPSAFKHIHITYSTVRSTFFFFFDAVAASNCLHMFLLSIKLLERGIIASTAPTPHFFLAL